MDNFSFFIDNSSVGIRIDKWLTNKEINITRSSLQKLIDDGRVLVNSIQISKNYKLHLGDKIDLSIPDPVELDIKAQNLPVEIVYEDDDLLVVNKPKGMVVHPAPGHSDGTLVNALLYHCKGRLSSINGVIRPGIVHRIDKNTSGLLIVAKNDNAHLVLAQQIKEHSFTREYQAVLCGKLKNESGIINAPIGRDKYDRKKMCVTEINSKQAITNYEVLKTFTNYTFAKFILETGRTHQIRVHSAYIGNPVYGDDVYGRAVKGLEGQCLHAKKIGFIHPTTKKYMEFESQLPQYFTKIINNLN